MLGRILSGLLFVYFAVDTGKEVMSILPFTGNMDKELIAYFLMKGLLIVFFALLTFRKE